MRSALRAGGSDRRAPEVADTIPEFTVTFPVIGNRWLVGAAFIVHITAVAFIIGIAMVAPVAELLGNRRGGERWLQLSRDLSTIIERLYAWGATWAAFGLVSLWALYPRLWGYLTSLFFVEVIVIAGFLWIVMSVTAYLYYATWDRLRNRRALHNAIGWTFTLATMAFISLIVMFSSHQLTPVGGQDAVQAATFNTGYLAEELHRQIGNLSYGPLLLGGLLAASLLVFRGRFSLSEEQRAFRRWAVEAMLVLGLLVMLLQPISGWYYVRQLVDISPGAWSFIMPGPNGWMFLIQIGLLGGTFLLANAYLALSAPVRDDRRERPWERSWLRWSLIILGLALLLALVPKELPLGKMRPWKYLALGTFAVVTLLNLIAYWRLRRRGGVMPSGWQRSAVAVGLGVTLIALFVTMGIIRETARGDWLIYQKMPPEQAQELVRP